MKRAYVWVNGRQVHYRSAGNGAPVVLLHPSPLSGAAVWPVASSIARHFEVFALDTPGYGQSEPLAAPPESLADYLPTLAATLDALGLQKICLYGCATGAQIAIEFAKVYPQRVALLVLDTAGHIPAEECQSIVSHYFPDVTPQSDGRHLVTLWQMVRDLFVFFPWCDTRSQSRISRDLPPPAVMQGMLLDYLRAGKDYHLAYRPAFHNERAERAQAVTVPTVLTRWEGSIALRITDALIAQGLPANFSVLPLGASPAERTEGIAARILAGYGGDLRVRGNPAMAASLDASRVFGSYLPFGDRQLHLRSSGGTSKPLLLLHDVSGSSAVALQGLPTRLGERPLLAIDLPGHGESEAGPGSSPAGPIEDAALLRDALRELGCGACDVAAFGAARLTATALAKLQPGLIGHIELIDPASAVPASLKVGATPDLIPRPDGTHLLAAWQWLRDQALWRWPGVTQAAAIRAEEPAMRLEAERLHLQLTELMKIGPAFSARWTATQAALTADPTTH